MAPGKVNPKLALTAHYKAFLHAFLLTGLGAAASFGVFPRISATTSAVSFYSLVGGCWVSLVADVNASFLGVHLPIAAANANAKADDKHPNSTVIVVSALSVVTGCLTLCSAIDMAAVTFSK